SQSVGQFNRIKGLRHNASGADGEKLCHGLLVHLSRGEYDRQIHQGGYLSKFLEGLLPIYSWHHYVEKDEIRCERFSPRECLLAGVALQDGKSAYNLQRNSCHRANVLVIVHVENSIERHASDPKHPSGSMLCPFP